MKPLLKVLFVALVAISPALAATPSTPAGPPPQIIVAGKVRITGTLPFTEGLTAVQVLLKSGGVVTFADARVFLIRHAKSTLIPIREVIEKGNDKADVLLQPWDIIYIQ